MIQLKKIASVLSALLILIVFNFCGDNKIETGKAGVDKLFAEADNLPPDSSLYFSLADSAFSLASKIGYENGKDKSLLYLGNHYLEKNRIDSAVEKFNAAVKSRKNRKPDKILGDSYNNLARSYYRIPDFEKAIVYFRKAAETREEIKDSVGLGVSLNNLGMIFWRLSVYDSAIIYFEKALSIREKTGIPDHLASTFNNLGTIYYRWAMYDKALDYYLKALKIRRGMDDKRSISVILCNIGLLYDETEDTSKARSYFSESLDYVKKINDTQLFGYIYFCIGSFYENKNLDSSMYFYRKSLKKYLGMNYDGGMLEAEEGIGKVLIQQGNFNEAEKIFREIEKTSIEIKLQLRTAYAERYLGLLFKKRKKYNEAEKFYLKSNELSDKLNYKNILRENFKDLNEIYKAQGKLKSALNAANIFMKLNVELNREESKRKLNELTKQFELEKYRRSLELVKLQNEKQKLIISFSLAGLIIFAVLTMMLVYLHIKKRRANILLAETNRELEEKRNILVETNLELEELNRTRDKFYSIIAHDLKNPFISLYGYTEILKNEYYDLSDEERIEYIKETELSTKKTYNLLENLLELSAARTGKMEFRPIKISVPDLINKTIDLTRSQAADKKIKIKSLAENNIFVYADEMMIETVIRNLLTNAIKFSNVGRQIDIGASAGKEETTIFIKDYGVGMSEDTLTNLFNFEKSTSTRGTKEEKGTGLGLVICKEFVEKNGGKIWAESELEKGTVFYFTLPVSE